MQENLKEKYLVEEEDEDLETEEEISETIEEKIAVEDIKPSRKLDYTLQSPQDRNEYVKKIISETPPEQLTNKYLEILADYIIFAMDKEERKTRKIITDNRMITINKRETSFEGLISKFENGEDGIYNMITNDKNIIFAPKVSITQKDIDEIPDLKKLREAIEQVEKAEKVARGKHKYLLKKQLIEMRQDQYIIKNSFRKPMYCINAIKSFSQLDLKEDFYFDEKGIAHSTGLLSLLNQKHISALLCHYSKLKEEAWGKFSSDAYYLMEDLDCLVEQTLKDKYPLYYDLLILKIDGKQNNEIQTYLEKTYGIKHSVEYISSLWRNKIPKLLAEQSQENYLNWYYTEKEKGKWKKCSRCGEVKLAHNKFFSKNKTSKDGFYSICKVCRNKKEVK
jgi:hypothetical protein